jgi:hypothetical protein
MHGHGDQTKLDADTPTGVPIIVECTERTTAPPPAPEN